MFLYFFQEIQHDFICLEIFIHIQIKQLILFVFFILFLTIKQNIHKKTKHPLPLLFYYTHSVTCLHNNIS